MPAVLGLIRELAEYEKAPGEVALTAEELRRDGFGPRPAFEALLAEEDGEALGMAFYYLSYSTWKGRCVHLEDLVVKRAHRGRGIGRALLGRVEEKARELGARRLQWQVLAWNEPAIEFYRKIGAEVSGEWLNCRLAGARLERA